jgi:hypothetical protein
MASSRYGECKGEASQTTPHNDYVKFFFHNSRPDGRKIRGSVLNYLAHVAFASYSGELSRDRGDIFRNSRAPIIASDKSYHNDPPDEAATKRIINCLAVVLCLVVSSLPDAWLCACFGPENVPSCYRWGRLFSSFFSTSYSLMDIYELAFLET